LQGVLTIVVIANSGDGNSIRPAVLVSYYKAGFKLIPLSPDSNAVMMQWGEVYDNPDFWFPQKLISQCDTFKNVATVFGKTHKKGPNGEDLFLHCIDIDSENVYKILSAPLNSLEKRLGKKVRGIIGRLQGRQTGDEIIANSISLLDILRQNTFLVKTRKEFGFHAYWFETTLQKAVHLHDCKREYGFELKCDKGSGHATLPPSRHRDDPSFRYQTVGVGEIANIPGLYDMLVNDLLNDCILSKSLRDNKVAQTVAAEAGHLTTNVKNFRSLSQYEIDSIAIIVLAVYKLGFRNDIALGLSGLLFKQGIDLESAEKLFSNICDSGSDPEKESRVQVLRDSYTKGANGQQLTGSMWHAETIASVVGNDQMGIDIVTKISKILGAKKRRNKSKSSDQDQWDDRNDNKIILPIDDTGEKESYTKYKDAGKNDAAARKARPIHHVKKFSTGIPLAEAIIVNKDPYFVQVIDGKVVFSGQIKTPDMVLRPPHRNAYPADSYYEFSSFNEVRQYIRRSMKETIYTLYKRVEQNYTKQRYVDTEERYTVLLTVDTIASYFQDRFGTVHYDFCVGDNESGKNSILLTYASQGYRPFLTSGATGANIREYLGTVEEGQGTIAEDEMDDIEQDLDKMRLFKTGYASGGNVPKTLDANTSSRQQRYYWTYGFKIVAAEKLPSDKQARGLLNRSFVIRCVKGKPRYNIKYVRKYLLKPGGNEPYTALAADLLDTKKLLLAFRLVHFEDPIDEIPLTVEGRADELTGPEVRLFYKYCATPEDKKIFEKILDVLSGFVKERSEQRRSGSIEGRIYAVVAQMVKDSGDILENDAIFSAVKEELEGADISGKAQSFYTQDFGTISHAKITKILKENFKANSTSVGRDKAKKRALYVSKQVLAQIGTAYNEPWRIQILPPGEGPGKGNSNVDHNSNDQWGLGTQNIVGTLEKNNDYLPIEQDQPGSAESVTEKGAVAEQPAAKSASDSANITTSSVDPAIDASTRVSPPEHMSPPTRTNNSASGNQTNSPLGDNHAAFDLEWSTGDGEPVIFAAAIVDSKGNYRVLHASDFGNSEASLVKAVVNEIKKYPVTLGWGTTIITESSSTHTPEKAGDNKEAGGAI
jgi:hypothetical protein